MTNHHQKVLYGHQNFSGMVLFFSDDGTQYTVLPLSFPKKTFPLFLNLTRQCGMLSARRSTTRAWGCMKHDCLCSRVGLQSVPTHTYVKSWPSCLLQCRTYPGSHESAVHVVMGRGRQSAFVGSFSWLSCARTQVHMFSCLFVRICLHATCSNKIMGIEGIAK